MSLLHYGALEMSFTITRRQTVCGLMKYGFVGGVMLSLGACTHAPQAPTFGDIQFSDGPKIPVRALKVDVVADYQPSFQSPNVEHLMPVPPERVARQWVIDRLQPLRSGQTVVQFIITDASVTETKLKTKSGLKGAFTDEPSERYDANLKAKIVYKDPVTLDEGSVETTAHYSMTVQEGASLNDREKVWFELAQKLGTQFDMAMTENIEKFLPQIVAKPE